MLGSIAAGKLTCPLCRHNVTEPPALVHAVRAYQQANNMSPDNYRTPVNEYMAQFPGDEDLDSSDSDSDSDSMEYDDEAQAAFEAEHAVNQELASGDPVRAQAALDAGGNVDSEGGHPLLIAVRNNNVRGVAWLLQHGANVQNLRSFADIPWQFAGPEVRAVLRAYGFEVQTPYRPW